MINKFIYIFSFILITVTLNSCGNNSLEGTWNVDISSLDITFGEAFPEEMKKNVEGVAQETKNMEDNNSKLTIELLKNGKAILKHSNKTENKEINWSKKKDKINFNGVIDNQNFDIDLDIISTSKNTITIGLKGESILKQIREKRPEMIKKYDLIFNLDNLAKGTKISINMNKIL